MSCACPRPGPGGHRRCARASGYQRGPAAWCGCRCHDKRASAILPPDASPEVVAFAIEIETAIGTLFGGGR